MTEKELNEILESMRVTRDMIRSSIQDLEKVCEAYDRIINTFNDPIMILTMDGQKLQEKLNKEINRANIYMSSFSSKYTVLGAYLNSVQGKENENEGDIV